MPWSERSTMSLRREFVELALAEGSNMQALCERFGISRQTGYKWLGRYEAEGYDGLADRSRRPASSPRRIAESIERDALAVRDEHPAWGARKILRVLQTRREGVDLGDLPSVSTLTEVLRRNGRLDPLECVRHRPHVRFEHAGPNAMWQMDFKGHFGLSGGGRCHPLTVLDDHSRFCLLLVACADEKASTVQEQLIRCFREQGLPDRILCDNGPPWGGAGAIGAHTGLSVWMIRLGVQVYHGRPWHPQTQGKEERFHRTLLDELVRPVMGLSVRWNAGAAPASRPGADQSQSGKVVNVADHASCQLLFDPWRTVYNQVRPHEAIGMHTPASRYQPSARPFPEELPSVQYPSVPGQVVRKVQTSGEVSFHNRMVFVGSAFAGEPVALRPSQLDGLFDVYYCQQRIAFIDLRTLDERRPNNKTPGAIKRDQQAT